MLAIPRVCACSLLQDRLRALFPETIGAVRVPGTDVIPVALSDALDGKLTSDYEARVEPSVTGGEKLARLLLDRLHMAGVDARDARASLL